VIRCPNWVGDAVMATPTLRAVRRGFPQARIVLAGTARIRDVLEPGPFHDAYLVLRGHRAVFSDARRLRTHRFDLGLLLTNSFGSALSVRLGRVRRRVGYDRDGRGWLLTDRAAPRREGRRVVPAPVLDSYLELAASLGCPTHDRRMELDVAPADEAAAAVILEGAAVDPDRPLVLITPGAAFGAAKLWPADRFAAVADRLADRLGAAVLVAAAPTEAPVAEAVVRNVRATAVNLAAQGTSLGVLKAFVRRCAILVTNDSGPRHFAAAFDRPVVTIFGPTDRRWSETDHPKETCMLPNCDCAPCQRRTCPTDHRCMDGITTDIVMQACNGLLDRFGEGL
jgi:heptosyltransferase-2